jgi:hypothetical protein
MKHDPETLREFLSIISSRPNTRNACRACGFHPASLYGWIKRSNQGDPKFLLDFPEGDPPQQFAQHIVECRKISRFNYESQMRDEVEHGIPRVLRDPSTNNIVYEQDPNYVGVSDEDMELLGLDPVFHRIQRDRAGMPVPSIVYDPAPAQLKIAVLRTIPGYGDTKTVKLDHVVSGSVLQIGAPGQEPRHVIEHVIEQIAAPVAEEVTHDDPDADLLGEVAEEVAAPVAQAQDAPVIEHASVRELRELAAMSPEDRRARLQGSARPSAPITPAYSSAEDRSEGIGHGTVPPGGMKMA